MYLWRYIPGYLHILCKVFNVYFLMLMLSCIKKLSNHLYNISLLVI
jgi:hypothetical protein